ncbi:DUF1772 domain-containing protein [Micromonospora sp. NPDC051925]|uniref:DUF1772 domain-containing protein n=1 Tax=Micromonospora sp. NPDC051925 TaxID=3364288 RepID=UPI0037C74938
MSAVVLLVATVTTGVMAGIFFGFSCAVMPALARLDDPTFIRVMQRINSAIQNGLFALVFLGALVSGAGTLWWHPDRPGLRSWLIAGFTAYVVTLAITFVINIPLNNRLDRAGPAERLADPRTVRQGFEKPWVRWHTLRTLTCLAAFACFCIALSSA